MPTARALFECTQTEATNLESDLRATSPQRIQVFEAASADPAVTRPSPVITDSLPDPTNIATGATARLSRSLRQGEAYMPDFVGSFNEYFDVVRADTPDLLDRVYCLRFQVYCVENEFLNPAHYPDGRETDEDDDRSVHTMLIHRTSGAVAGTARLILPRPNTGRPLPVQQFLRCTEPLRLGWLPLQKAGEISRFAVSKEFRRRCSEALHVDTGFGERLLHPGAVEKRLMPHITFGLIRGILGICLEYEITSLAAVMEPPLLRLLARLGLHFDALGPLVEYHGLRQPCAAAITELIHGARDHCDLLWRYVEADVAALSPPPVASDVDQLAKG